MYHTFHVTPEHQARELINMVMLLQRCLRLPDPTAAERAEWRAELSDARHRLGDLLNPGLEGERLTRRLAADFRPVLGPS